MGGSLAYFQIEKSNRDNASAGLNCPTNYLPVNGQCVATASKIANTNYSCWNGVISNTADCSYNGVKVEFGVIQRNYSGPETLYYIPHASGESPLCPNAYTKVVSGGDGNEQLCAKSNSQIVSNTTYTCPSGYTDNGSNCIATATPTSYTIDINTGISTCTPSANNLNSGVAFNCTFGLSGSPIGTYAIPSEGLYAGIRNVAGNANTYLGNSNLCTVSGTVLTCIELPHFT